MLITVEVKSKQKNIRLKLTDNKMEKNFNCTSNNFLFYIITYKTITFHYHIVDNLLYSHLYTRVMSTPSKECHKSFLIKLL